jgi:hypothetical protein
MKYSQLMIFFAERSGNMKSGTDLPSLSMHWKNPLRGFEVSVTINRDMSGMV